MDPYYEAPGVTLYLGDCIEVMRTLPEASVDAVVCDPPYGLEFMGKEWDAPWKHAGDVVDDPASVGGFQDGNGGNPYSRSRIRYGNVPEEFQAWCEAWAREAYRVLKPGGHLLAFGGTRTHHRLVCGIEDAGFEIRDELDWMFGSGFPKSLDVSKAIDRMAGAERTPIMVPTKNGNRPEQAGPIALGASGMTDVSAPATAEAARWAGWGTALKPAHEPICLARKPLDGTVAATVLKHGTGALNIDGTRIEGNPAAWGTHTESDGYRLHKRSYVAPPSTSGRWPANVLLDEEAAALLDASVPELVSGSGTPFTRNADKFRNTYSAFEGTPAEAGYYGDRGGPSRFYYTSKASRSEREAGLDDLPPNTVGEITGGRDSEAPGANNPRSGAGRGLSSDDSIAAWVNAVLEAVRREDMGALLRRVTEGFTTADDSEWSTMSSGSESVAPSPPDSTFTTSTETSSITSDPTSGSLTGQHINAFILGALSKLASGTSPVVFAESVSRWMQRIGISVEKGGPSTTDVARVISERLSELNKKGGMPSRVVARRNDHPT